MDDLQKIIQTCGPKTHLQIYTTEKKFIEKLLSSPNYQRDFDLNYTESTETNVSKLYRACVKDKRGDMVGYLLRNNSTLLNILVDNEDDDDEARGNSME